MTDKLDEQSRHDLIIYRKERSDNALKEATLMFQNGFFNASVNRLYYACYYAASALMLKYNLSATSHAGIKTMLGLHFVSKGLISLNGGKTFSTLFDKRQSSDYEDFTYCDSETYAELRPKAENFIKEVDGLL